MSQGQESQSTCDVPSGLKCETAETRSTDKMAVSSLINPPSPKIQTSSVEGISNHPERYIKDEPSPVDLPRAGLFPTPPERPHRQNCSVHGTPTPAVQTKSSYPSQAELTSHTNYLSETMESTVIQYLAWGGRPQQPGDSLLVANSSGGFSVVPNTSGAKAATLERPTDSTLPDDNCEPKYHSDMREPNEKNATSELPSNENNPETEWEIEDILKQRKGKYLIQWKGTDPSTKRPWKPSWEPRKNLNPHALEFLKEKKRKREYVPRESNKKRKRKST